MADFKAGDRVLARQSNGMNWVSRYLYRDSENRAVIATYSGRNTCFAEWPYPDESLIPIEGAGWAAGSPYQVGMEVTFFLDAATPQYPKGTVLTGTILSPHIDPGDWYMAFPVPDGWEFHLVVNESCFQQSFIVQTRLEILLETSDL